MEINAAGQVTGSNLGLPNASDECATCGSKDKRFCEGVKRHYMKNVFRGFATLNVNLLEKVLKTSVACFIAILKFVGMDALNFANMCREVGVTVWNASMTWPFDPLPPPRPSPRDVVPLADKKEEEKE